MIVAIKMIKSENGMYSTMTSQPHPDWRRRKLKSGLFKKFKNIHPQEKELKNFTLGLKRFNLVLLNSNPVCDCKIPAVILTLYY